MAVKKPIRGITEDQTRDPGLDVRDVRPLNIKVVEWMRLPQNLVVTLLFHAAVAFMFPGLSDYAFVTACALFAWGMTRAETAPLKMPIQSGSLDPNQPHPANGKPTPGQGIFFIGNDIRNGKEVWLTNSDCRQHFLVLGTTGAGKAIDADEDVLTPGGWRRAGDLRPGDLVTTPDGGTAPLRGVFPQGVLPLNRVTLADGRSLEACDEHFWMGWLEGVGPRLMTTAEIARRLAAGDRITLPMPRALPLPPADVAAQDMADIASSAVSPAPGAEAGRLLKLAARGSVAQRQALMGALAAHARADKDRPGHAIVGGLRVEDALVLAEAARSLGGVASVMFDGATARLSWKGEPPLPRDRWLEVRSVERTRSAPAVCLSVDHPDRLFVAGRGCVVTHNTETLLGFAANALSWGSGFLFCDGKGDVALFAKVYAMARRFGREDDLLVLNFMNGNEDVGVMGGRLRSNTMNPFATGSSDGLTQMVVSLMDDVGGDGAMWKGRATAMLTGVMRALCWLRDQGLLDLNVGEIRDHMNLKKIIELGDEKIYPDLPQPIRKSIRSYLTSLPGYQEDKREKQAQTTLDQHGYLEMQFTKILGSLADVYGHIFATPYGQVDMHDVVLNRRILVIMLPALEKSGDEIANLGKIVVATLKGMMGGTLGSRLEGGWEDVVENRPTNSPSPFLCILDEVGYYTVEGMALMAAQARSLGFSMIYASQDIPAMKRLNEKEAASIIANTNTKIFMRTEEVSETGKLAVETGDKATRVRTSGFERQATETGVKYVEGQGTSFEETNRVNFTDLKAQGEGEMHIMFQEKLVRARGFYANPEGAVDKKKLKLRANHFIQVAKPSLTELKSAQLAPELMARMADPEFPATLEAEAKDRLTRLEELAANGDEIAMVARSFEKLIEAKRKPIEAACAAVADVMRALRGATSSFVEDVRTGYRQGAPMVPPSGGFGPADLDIVTPDMDPNLPPNGGFGGGIPQVGGFGPPHDFTDPFGPPPGVPFGHEPPPHLPPRRPFSQPRPAPRVRQDVVHGATVDDGEIMHMAEMIASNDAIMKSLAVLDFDGDSTTPERVETAIEEALGGYADVPPEAPAERGKVVSAVEAFDRAAAAIQTSGDEQGGEQDGGGEQGGELVSAFLEQLLADDE